MMSEQRTERIENYQRGSELKKMLEKLTELEFLNK